MAKPIIGVTTSISKGYFLWRCIQLGIWLAGGKPIRITPSYPKGYQQCQGFLIAGGVDIDPQLYDQQNTASQHIEPARDVLEQTVIQHALQFKKPMAGICRGAQMINIVLGGTLHQDATEIYADFLPTTSLLGKLLQRRKVTITQDGKILSIFQKNTLSVNSIHHQAINRVGNGLQVAAVDKHGIPQAIQSIDNQFIFGVQWHPELMLHQTKQRRFFSQLVLACLQSNH